jgi:putative membrane protein
MSDLNDPRVFFAAERTLLAWTRTSLTLMAFGFMIERFSLFLLMLSPEKSAPLHRNLSFWMGIVFLLLGTLSAAVATTQYQTVLRTLKPVEIPRNYRVNAGVLANLIIAALGIVLILYLSLHRLVRENF